MPEQIIDNKRNLFTTLHGVLLEVRGLGVLIIGKSGIGKSENALDLISRGSKLISDDVVVVKPSGTGRLVGSSPSKTKHLMEIRGIGIININDIYGDKSVLNETEIELIIELSKWDSSYDYDRLGFEEKSYNLMGTELPYLIIPTTPGKNISTILEVAARNHILKSKRSNTSPLTEIME